MGDMAVNSNIVPLFSILKTDIRNGQEKRTCSFSNLNPFPYIDRPIHFLRIMSKIKRRDFFKQGAIATMAGASFTLGCDTDRKPSGKELSDVKYSRVDQEGNPVRSFNGLYHGPFIDRVAFPIGGMGAGMICLEGTGCISHVSVRNTPDIYHEPFMFGAISVKGIEHGAKVLEGPVPHYKIFGRPNTGNGAGQTSYGFPRFNHVSFQPKFPFGEVHLEDEDIPLEVGLRGWSPFIPGDTDNSSLPVGALEYRFRNTSGRKIEAVFSYHAYNLMKIEIPSEFGGRYKEGDTIKSMKGGYILSQACLPEKPHFKGDFAIYTTDKNVVVDHSLFRGGWFDSRTIMWQDIAQGNMPGDPVLENTPGASLYVPVNLEAGEEKVVPLLFAWYVPHTDIRRGPNDVDMEEKQKACEGGEDCCPPSYTSLFYEPWYSTKFSDIKRVAKYWKDNYEELKEKSTRFSEALYDQTLPDEVIEAVAANLTILKSPTVLREKNGKMWAWEGCHDLGGCCHGSCTHVWNYAQAIPHLFPELERSLRDTEFTVSQSDSGHQTFRAALPIRDPNHGFHAASDGQLGGIMKMHREWRISGDTEWLGKLWPKVRQSMDYCIKSWDPKGKGVLEEPHHNTYDIEFWGPDGMCTSFYLGALYAMTRMGKALGEDVSKYQRLLDKGREYLENKLFDGEYFYHEIKWEDLETPSPLEQAQQAWNVSYSEEALELLKKEGPKYQYGKGCLSDGILGCWIGAMCGLDDFVDKEKVKSHLVSVHRYNLKKDLSDHVNPQRPAYALGHEGGLLLCSWPKGGKLSLPFVYSNEVWTGIEYQVASHLMLVGEVEKGLDIVRTLRKRYDGRIRNPFNEYECGHWYARAMASFGLIRGLTGTRYDAIDKTLFIDSRIGNDFKCFISTAKGFGSAGLENGKPFLHVVSGEIPVEACIVSGTEKELKLI